MITLQTAEDALKTVYLGVLTEQLNQTVNPFMAKIEQTSSDVWGKEIKKLASYGMNGGVGASSETADLPKAGGNNYAQFTLTLKNFYGKIELSDKAIRASQNSTGAFVNLLNSEMEGLLSNAKSNFGRMLYGDGSGLLAKCGAKDGGNNKCFAVDNVKYLSEGMIVDICKLSENTAVVGYDGVRITSIDRVNKKVVIDKEITVTLDATYGLYVQNSKNSELTGLGAIFSSKALYGLDRKAYSFMNPTVKDAKNSLTSDLIQEVIDGIEETTGGSVDMILTSHKARRKYFQTLEAGRTNVDYMNLDGGFKAISYNGIPLVVDRFCPDNEMYLLNSDDFKMHQLCDWRWLEGERGNVLKQVANKPVYTATLVKYADIICSRPQGQAKIINVI